MFKKNKKVEINTPKIERNDFTLVETDCSKMEKNFAIRLIAEKDSPHATSKTAKFGVYMLDELGMGERLNTFNSLREAKDYVRKESERLVG